jgi:multidrug efflux system outer membrane protein
LIPDLAERAWRTRSDVEAARAAVNVARAQRKAELSGYLPTVDLEWNRWLQRESVFIEPIDWTLSVSASWPLFDFGARDAAYSRALATVRQRELELASLRRQVRLEVEEAVLAFRSLGAAEGALAARAAAARAALDEARARHEAEEAVDLDLRAAERDLESALRELARLHLARKQAALKIRLAVGDFRLSDPMETMLKESAE